MSLATRGSRAAARVLRQPLLANQSRKYASDQHSESHIHGQGHGHGHGQGHGQSALHLEDANPSGSEGFGPGFYMTLAAVPLFYLGYSLAYGSENNLIAQQYQKYKEGKQATADADKLHQAVLREAIRDRTRLSSYPRERSGPALLNPEMFNAGSPWNQAAGGQTANLKDLEEHYKKVYAEQEQERLARIKDGKIKTLYD